MLKPIAVATVLLFASGAAYAAAYDDAFAAYRWACDEAANLGADPGRIALAGDSAGANLAAVVCQLARDGGAPAPLLQVLLYPVIDYSAKRRSYELFGEGFFLTREEMDWFRDNYFASDDDRLDPRASPILADRRQASQISTAARPSAPPTIGGRASRMLSTNSCTTPMCGKRRIGDFGSLR